VSGSIVQRTETVVLPNLHADTVLQADRSGTRVGASSAFDPFGEPIDQATGDIGTVP
jgi:hypothetical protein